MLVQTDWWVGWGPPASKAEEGFKTAPASTLVSVVVFLGLIFPVQGHWAGVPDVGLGPPFPDENLCCSNLSPVCGSPTQGYGSCLYYISSLLPVLFWLLHYIFSCSRSFLVDFGMFH